MVMGRETESQINSGILLAKRDAPFLSLWLETYKSYRGVSESWVGKATAVPHVLAGLYPHLIHVEETSLNQPNWREMNKIYFEIYNWSNNYAMHIWQMYTRKGVIVPQEPRDVDRLNTTLGEITRYILYGSKGLR